ncbi:MAG: hypothetical protein BWX91_01182 [Spirochaetes bacterium ADurb.Bin133]|nr:MAG: hypothetical protein BWX91_01182 [Spirochaetes bacterium ADurb.Bin133]
MNKVEKNIEKAFTYAKQPEKFPISLLFLDLFGHLFWIPGAIALALISTIGSPPNYLVAATVKSASFIVVTCILAILPVIKYRIYSRVIMNWKEDWKKAGDVVAKIKRMFLIPIFLSILAVVAFAIELKLGFADVLLVSIIVISAEIIIG